MKKHWVGEQYPISQRFLQEDEFTRKTYKSKVHFGLDIACREVPLYAPCDATVAGIVKGHASLGNCIYLDDGTYFQRLLHLKEIRVTEGQKVTAGQQIGVTGNTGMGGSYHLHVDIMKKPFVFANLLTKEKVMETMIDPLVWLKQSESTTQSTLSSYSPKQLLEEAIKRL